jgi:hypothetical protein
MKLFQTEQNVSPSIPMPQPFYQILSNMKIFIALCTLFFIGKYDGTNLDKHYILHNRCVNVINRI